MKKILIINEKHHSEIGGIETYTKKLINLFIKNKFCVFEMNRLKSKRKNMCCSCKNDNYVYINNAHCVELNQNSKLNKINIFNFINGIIKTIKQNKFINQIVKKYQIDVVIHNMYHLPKIRQLGTTKYIYVQHFDSEQYVRSKFSKLILKILFLKDSFKYKNIVTYTVNDISFLMTNRIIKHTSNIIKITPGMYDLYKPTHLPNHIYERKSQITFMGRLESVDKNVLFLSEITKQAKLNEKEIKIHVYGDGSKKNCLQQDKNLIIHEAFNNNSIKEIFNKTKLLILVSKHEGFGLVIVEALSHGVPCIIANTYLNASFLINDNRGKLMNNFDPQAWVDAINEIMNLSDNDYQKLSNNCLQFAKENLSLEEFNKKWIKLVN